MRVVRCGLTKPFCMARFARGIARRRAGHDREPHPQEHTVVIGDTPRDIACARADGVRVVAITTGPNTAAELQEADAVVDDVAGLEAALGYRDQ